VTTAAHRTEAALPAAGPDLAARHPVWEVRVTDREKLKNQTAQEADWIIGEGLFTPEVNGVGVRWIKNPGEAYDDKVLGKDPCPSNMSNYVHTQQDICLRSMPGGRFSSLAACSTRPATA